MLRLHSEKIVGLTETSEDNLKLLSLMQKIFHSVIHLSFKVFQPTVYQNLNKKFTSIVFVSKLKTNLKPVIPSL